MSEIPDSIAKEHLDEIAQKVRDACRAGKVIPSAELWEAGDEECLRLCRLLKGADIPDIDRIQHHGCSYLYSEMLMTRSYAERAARACSPDIRAAIAETVREDSRTYPRPTAVEIFRKAPFHVPQDLIERVVEEMPGDPGCPDIHLIRASDGSRFLFSSTYLDPAHAQSLAEWIAVGHLQNP